MTPEGKFKKDLKKKLKEMFPGCIITKLDASNIQGIPDMLVLWKDRWAALECKESKNASKRPNQALRVERMNNMSFASFIYPENEQEVLNDLERSFKRDS